MYILTYIRRNLTGKPDFIQTAKYANGRAMTFDSRQAALEYFQSHVDRPTCPVYGAETILVAAP
jgi:hypothetical protein